MSTGRDVGGGKVVRPLLGHPKNAARRERGKMKKATKRESRRGKGDGLRREVSTTGRT